MPYAIVSIRCSRDKRIPQPAGDRKRGFAPAAARTDRMMPANARIFKSYTAGKPAAEAGLYLDNKKRTAS
ncbi:hypothetical protein GCM10020370_45810 [Paenibacillus hodogayensis]